MLRKIASGVLLFSALASAQRGTGDWMTAAYDAQRSNWVRGDGKVTIDTVAKPGKNGPFGLEWKIKLNTVARQGQSLTPPALLDFYIGYRGFRALGFVAGPDRVAAMDIDLGRVEWEKGFPASGNATAPCPAGITSAVTRPTSFDYPQAFYGRGAGRATPARSDVGEPNEGAVTLKRVPPPRPAAPPPPPPTATAKPAAAAPNPFAPRIQWLLTITGDGKLHMFYVSNGEEPKPAAQFLPAGGAMSHGLIAVDGVAYVATKNGCGGVDNGVYAMDLETKQVSKWKAQGSGVAGISGVAFDPEGTAYAAGGGGELVALTSRTLGVKASYKASGVEFTSSPMVFDYKGSPMLAVATNKGTVQMYDTQNLAKGPVGETAAIAGSGANALTTWQDAAGVRWILIPTANNIAAWKVVDKGGKAAFERGWASKELVAPAAPVVLNGVIFALSSGKAGTPAVLYALEGTAGRELWNSGSTITGHVTTGVLSAGGSRVYVGTHDGTQYAFGFPIEH
ncbi:MAG: PQQ-like beta-propeller repeat protein [Bryobacterales bacterium]|nr:PQQ-like beta-propeller repeat protein [Bryobacterales bacterium]